MKAAINYLNQLATELAGQIEFILREGGSSKEANAKKSQLENLNQLKFYAETNPSRDYLEAQKAILEKNINVRTEAVNKLMERFTGSQQSTRTRQLEYYRKEYELPRYEQQLKNIDLLLKAMK